MAEFLVDLVHYLAILPIDQQLGHALQALGRDDFRFF
jgi:hypothetical protein